ncbi:aldo/keto reductase [Paenibacillus psychroresistens]|uniref:Aldo/keto reductase n=1 Tax=Paenibacillus psychroresistens TaxID=1778678 RepID=A0A6B8RF23_9BACL|nr:aldo/keto reductase [Paenibacillus psychroresistens]QGQ95091.1 aldo/keto reductase [Paenibacillus psychroresistens]
MITRTLGNSDLKVSSIGLGMMGMSPGIYGQTNDEDSIRTIHRALELGVTLLDTASLYGFGHNEQLLGKALKNRREQAVVATKFGFQKDYSINGRPDFVRKSIDESLQHLDLDHVDLYYQHRVDPNVPIEETVGAMADLVKAGKVRYLGLSEAGAATIRRAHAVHPISALQTEYSLWSREIENDILPVVTELGLTHVAYSPLSRGIISGEIASFEDLTEDDIRRHMPRYQGENFQKNLDVLEEIKKIAREKACTPSQLALAWTIANGALPIPGTKRISYLEENTASVNVVLTANDLARIESVSPKDIAHGERMLEMHMKDVNL